MMLCCLTGMHTIGVAGHSSMKELQLAGADRVLAELKDLQAQDIRDLSSQPPASDMPPNPTPVQQVPFAASQCLAVLLSTATCSVKHVICCCLQQLAACKNHCICMQPCLAVSRQAVPRQAVCTRSAGCANKA